MTSIPSWTASGVLPPINPAAPTSVDRSPYEVSLTDLILHFNTSPERQSILIGLLDLRKELHALGILQGFQWLDGSFMEHIETIENRAPKDIDVVTFFYMPQGETQGSLLAKNRPLFVPQEAKGRFHVDAHYVQLDGGVPEALVTSTSYWYSVWSHRRNGDWKGYLRVDLSPNDDQAAHANVISSQIHGGQP